MMTRMWQLKWHLKHRWRDLVCTLKGHHWYYGSDRGNGLMFWSRQKYPSEIKWCGRCGRLESNL